ncbi:hypothetical protein BJ742DRAFT_760190 [Cladochytrium replicatum]|nr:hypothetical protein BJ742DRAFT_760190 [Cladochytrium replicatum]
MLTCPRPLYAVATIARTQHYRVEHDRAWILENLLNGLQRLEYRGYDSVGISIDGDGNDSPADIVVKEVGKVVELRKKVAAAIASNEIDVSKSFESGVAIAHTRWATHGVPSIRNGHPQRSDHTGEFIVVHNGIITNNTSLKTVLEKFGYVYESDTDTETIAKLCKYIYDSEKATAGSALTFPRLVKAVCAKLEGAFGLLFKSRHYPCEVVAARRGSPLLVGVKTTQKLGVNFVDVDTDTEPVVGGTNGFLTPGSVTMQRSPSRFLSDNGTPPPVEYIIASDASAIIEHTKKVLYLEDDDLAHIAQGDLHIHRIRRDDRMSSIRPVHILDAELAQIQKGMFSHFMLKEIYEQPESVVSTMRGRLLVDDSRVVLGGLRTQLANVRRSRRIIFIACGTSYHSCLASRALFAELTELPISVEVATSFLDEQVPIFRDDCVIFVSQSGETKDSLRALSYCKERGALCVGVTNTVGSTISRETHCGVHINAGPEICVASTKAYTSQVVALVMIALQLSDDNLGKQMRREAIIAGLVGLSTMIKRTLGLQKEAKRIAEELAKEEHIILLGRGYQGATCLEGALKIKEESYVHAEGILAGELKHGCLALIDKSMPVILIMNQDRHYKDVENAFKQVTARGGRPIVICDENDESSLFDGLTTIPVPQTVDVLQGIINIIPLQMIAYYMSVAKGVDPDYPRNLAKSVTVD